MATRHLRSLAAAIVSFAFIASTYAGYAILHPIAAASSVAALMGAAMFPRFNLKFTVCLLNGYFVRRSPATLIYSPTLIVLPL